jgi:glyoxylase-like metal-dependent hydrolase (beta-lactamase superfamily II)
MGITIRPLQLGVFLNYEKSKFSPAEKNYGVKNEYPILGYLIEGAGKRILVDTGPPAPEYQERYLPGWKVEIRQDGADKLPNRLRQFGYEPQDIDLVVITHLHIDHCYNTESLTGARFLLQKRELTYAVNTLPMDKWRYLAPGCGVNPPWFEFFDRLQLVDGDYEIAPGVRGVFLPGHVPGMQGVLCHTDAGRILIAGDAIPLFENWYNPSGKIISGICNNVYETYETLDKIGKIADFVLPGHDGEVFKQEVYGL